MFPNKSKSIVGIDLFAGAGGLSLGARMAGINVVLAIEKDKYAASTYSFNHPDTTVITDDIQNVKALSKFPIGSNTQSILFGGPPCQGFSSSNRRTNNRMNTQNWLYQEFIRILNLWRPNWVVFENVTGIVEFESGAFLKEIISDFQNAGYACSYSVLNASSYGVPQNRSRFFLVGSQKGISIDMNIGSENNKTINVIDALSDLPLLSNGAHCDILPYPCCPKSDYAKMLRGSLSECSGNLVSKNADYVISRYKYIEQGGNWSSIPSGLMENYSDYSRCHTGIYHRLCENKPSVVIGNYRKNMLIHPWADRGLSVREAARLQSFPDSYTFKGSIGFQQQQVGNAVPPLLAKHVFDRIIEQV